MRGKFSITSQDNIKEDEKSDNIISLPKKRKTRVKRKNNKPDQFSLEPFLNLKVKASESNKKDVKQDRQGLSHINSDNVLERLHSIVESLNNTKTEIVKEPENQYLLLTNRVIPTMPSNVKQDLPLSEEDKLAEALLPHINKWLDDYMPRLIQHALQKRSKV